MHSREVEAALLTRCAAVGRTEEASALDQREANVFRVAAMVVQSRFPREAARLMAASDRYFATHPAERLAVVEVVKQGCVISLPRLRDRLSLQFERQTR